MRVLKFYVIQIASEHIAPLQDAVDLEITTEEVNIVAGGLEEISVFVLTVLIHQLHLILSGL